MHPLRLLAATVTLLLGTGAFAAPIPLPEHPRPDFERAQWASLNGPWAFRFDPADSGLSEGWAGSGIEFPDTICVPFPWGSKLSGIEDEADIAWYRRSIRVPEAWRGQRVFLVVGACDWTTTAWLDGRELGEHRGGYTPFEFELTPSVCWGGENEIVLRVDDTPHPFKLEGKQGYGEAKGIWQTAYLEARPAVHLVRVHFLPDPAQSRVLVRATLSDPAPAGAELRLRFKNTAFPEAAAPVAAGAREAEFAVDLPGARRWSLDDPFLHETEIVLRTGTAEDRVAGYFGMRSIGVGRLPGSGHPCVTLDGRPVYLQMTLDQAYHPDGFYTFPSDAFMRDEILRTKRLGLNAARIHIKAEIPRKLHWADRLGLLIMADVPNFWGEPTPEARRESEFALRGMVQRDFNHPSIFSWVLFNETWGLFTEQGGTKTYLPETQDWAASMYRLAKQLDPTRLVEDNSPVNFDHVETDLNSWHEYLPGCDWREKLERIDRDVFPGSAWNFIGGRTQGAQPLLNSECGNVWGYHGSTGDVDWSWDYHAMINEFRRHPKIAGWLYTEHHDVVNEWNGYYRCDRSEKTTGLDAFVPGMTVADFHTPLYLSTGSDLCREVRPGATVHVPLFASFLTGLAPGRDLVLRWTLHGWDRLGRPTTWRQDTRAIPFEPWAARDLDPLEVAMPEQPALAVLALVLENEAGVVLHRNFTTFLVGDGPAPRDETVHQDGRALRLVRFAPSTFAAARWSLKQWNVLGGLKAGGAGHGFFEYRIPWPQGLDPAAVASVSFVCEASAKQLFGKDVEGSTATVGDFMRGQGTFDPASNPNAYPMTDATLHPSSVRVRVAGIAAATVFLPDDPADHRGVLSWFSQPRDRRLREAGSYGWLVQTVVPPDAIAAAARAGEIVLRLEVDEALPGGLALYGERFGRYPLDPTLVFELR
jgi:hypothetical protein